MKKIDLHEDNAQDNVNSANNNGRKFVKHVIFNSILNSNAFCPVAIQEKKS